MSSHSLSVVVANIGSEPYFAVVFQNPRNLPSVINSLKLVAKRESTGVGRIGLASEEP